MTDINAVMTADASGKEMVEFSRQTADTLVRNSLTRAQIRTIFTEVRKIEALWAIRNEDARRRLNMLKPKMDYQVSRSQPVQVLRDVLSKAIDTVESASSTEERNKRFKRFVELFEAILAYHRALDGKK